MRNILRVVIFFVVIISFPSMADECTQYWDYLLSTDPLVPKGLSGDAHAAYGVLSFRGDPSTKFVVRGEFPNARFMSFSTVHGKKHHPVSALEDHLIVPDEGSENPYREGAEIDAANRSYTLHVLPEGVATQERNVLRLPNNDVIHAFMFRVFSPNAGAEVTERDFPRVYAHDLVTNAPKACPIHEPLPVYFRFPQFLTIIVPRKETFTFKAKKIGWGPNSAIPQYTYVVNPLDKGDELLKVRFKSPSFVDTTSGKGLFPSAGDVRYWSICAQNFPKNETLACLPDHLARRDEQGYVTLVLGKGDDVRRAAEARGYNFLEDTRARNQFVAGLVYRNIFPKSDFAKNFMHKGDYMPSGVLCSRQEFVSGDCE